MAFRNSLAIKQRQIEDAGVNIRMAVEKGELAISVIRKSPNMNQVVLYGEKLAVNPHVCNDIG